MTDGTHLRQSWLDALNEAEAAFRKLVTSSSAEWKRVATTQEESKARVNGKERHIPSLSDVVVYRQTGKRADNVYRVVLDLPVAEDTAPLEAWKSILSTPELRKEWDPAVESAQLVEMFDCSTRIAKTNFTLGWPANPRDSVTISRTFHDSNTVLDVATSLPRSPDEPAYLRPSPPYVRSEVKLLAWCIQHIQPPQPPAEQSGRPTSSTNRLRVTCYWNHEIRAMWSFSSSSSVSQQLGATVLGLYKLVQKRAFRVPTLIGYGHGITIERLRFEIDREALTIDYAIHPEEEHPDTLPSERQGMDDLQAIKEARRLTRSIECVLPSPDGWDVQLTTKASRPEVAKLPWVLTATRTTSGTSPAPSPSRGSFKPPHRVVLDVRHAPLPDDHSILKVRVSIELSGPSSGLRLNGLPQPIEEVQERDPTSYSLSKQLILQDAASTADMSFATASSIATAGSGATGSTKTAERPQLARTLTARTPAADKAILSRVKRNYIYFSSLLQEPEAKWKRNSEARGVEVTQLDSIDPTLVVYRAEATFVGVGLWDLYATIMSPGARIYWDKLHEDANLLEDVNELTDLWHFKSKPAWPVGGRDAALLRTVYKSPTAVHVFAFSADDLPYFNSIPPTLPNIIRTQVDLQGWSIEALSPTTTSLTLLEQSDPKGWTNKTSIPQQMIGAVAGIGEFAIKCGGPPAVTRLTGGKATQSRYDHERGQFRFEYLGSTSRRIPSPGTETEPNSAASESSPQMPTIECELRCDVDAWAASLDIVVDPPPQTLTCLRRHKLSAGGGGLWLTVSHDAVFVGSDRVMILVRRGPSGSTGKENKGAVLVNGTRINVDIEELPEQEAKNLAKQKRVKPARVPLDQPLVMGAIRRRRAEWAAEEGEASEPGTPSSETPGRATPDRKATSLTQVYATPKFASPLTKMWTMAVEGTQQAVAAVSPMVTDGQSATSGKAPMLCALEALAHVQRLYAQRQSDEWVSMGEKGLPVHRRTVPEVSSAVAVHRGQKVIEGISAEDLILTITTPRRRKVWDDRFDGSTAFESFGSGCVTSFTVSKGGFPFRDRGFFLASVLAKTQGVPTASRRNSGASLGEGQGRPVEDRSLIFHVSASFNQDAVASYTPSKYNVHNLPVGRVILDGWVLETLDPYGAENYAIPSARCTRFVAVDYGGSIPAAMNALINAALPKGILALEAYAKGAGAAPLPLCRLPAPCALLTGKKDDGDGWVFTKRDDRRTLLASEFDPSTSTYWAKLLMTLPSEASRPTLEETTPRPSRLGARSPQPSSTPVEGHGHRRTMSQSGYNTLPRAKRPSVSIVSPTGSSRTASPAARMTSPPPSSRTSSPAPRLTSPPPPTTRSRKESRSSAFTVKGEVKPPTDFLVAEVVVDTKLYSSGAYDVCVRSAIHDTAKPASLSVKLGDLALPLSVGVFALPPAGLGSDAPRHLVRLTLPTAQFQVSTLEDPLTGEVRSAPPKPAWLLALEAPGKCAVVGVEIKSSSTVPATTSTAGKKEKAKKAKTASTAVTVTVDDAPVDVVGDSESLRMLGREELQDDRMGKMSIIQRGVTDNESLATELTSPLAIATALLDPTSLKAARAGADGALASGETGAAGSLADGVEGRAEGGDETRPSTPVDGEGSGAASSSTVGGNGAHGEGSGRGLLGFLNLNAYAKTGSAFLGRASSSAKGSPLKQAPAPPSPARSEASLAPPGALQLASVRASAQGQGQGRHGQPGAGGGGYPLSTVLVVALIAFLLGSLLRSLLSPAEFVYVAREGEDWESHVGESGEGWREMRRLFEVKYVAGGWDLQVGVVRRH